MTIEPERLQQIQICSDQLYSRQEARLYALSLGFGSDPLNEAELDFVTDRKGFRVVPTMAAIFADVILQLTAECRLQRPELALHGAQELEIFAPLPASAELQIKGTISKILDRGAHRGAEIHMLAEATVAGQDQPLYRTTYVTVARGDGGFGGLPPAPGPASAAGHAGEPDAVWGFQTPPNQALLYGLNGDPNPIHLQPKVARKAGFEVPILHGLCTYGIACRALLATWCDYDPARIKKLVVRFSAPVIPGDLLEVQMWRDGKNISFQVVAANRQVTVLKSGFCQLV